MATFSAPFYRLARRNLSSRGIHSPLPEAWSIYLREVCSARHHQRRTHVAACPTAAYIPLCERDCIASNLTALPTTQAFPRADNHGAPRHPTTDRSMREFPLRQRMTPACLFADVDAQVSARGGRHYAVSVFWRDPGRGPGTTATHLVLPQSTGTTFLRYNFWASCTARTAGTRSTRSTSRWSRRMRCRSLSCSRCTAYRRRRQRSAETPCWTSPHGCRMGGKNPIGCANEFELASALKQAAFFFCAGKPRRETGRCLVPTFARSL